MENNITEYRGNYIKKMRKTVGHAPLMVTSCGVIIENADHEILLQKRRDNGCWALPGGSMEIGEKFIDVVKREVFEEAGIEIGELELFGIYSGEDRIIFYPNQDVCCVTSIVFLTSQYRGNIQNGTDEALKHCFFSKMNLPENINNFDKKIISDWSKGLKQIVID